MRYGIILLDYAVGGLVVLLAWGATIWIEFLATNDAFPEKNNTKEKKN